MIQLFFPLDISAILSSNFTPRAMRPQQIASTVAVPLHKLGVYNQHHCVLHKEMDYP